MANHIDPVCRVQVDKQNTAGISEYKGTTYYFHSEECMSAFNQHPERYAQGPDEGPAAPASDETGRAT